MDPTLALITAVLLDENWQNSGGVNCLSIDEWVELARCFRVSGLSSDMKTRLISRIQIIVEAEGVNSGVFWLMITAG